MQRHIEFFDNDHFENNYHRKKARKSLSLFIDYFWETKFEHLYSIYPDGFSDALFPNIGYTYLINLGTPFIMQLGQKKFEMRSDGFLPRHQEMTCYHSAGNKIFGIKFKVSPVLFEKKVNFSEYRQYIFPLAYLIEKSLIEKIKAAPDFTERVQLASDYYERIVNKYEGSLRQINIVTDIIKASEADKNFDLSVEHLAKQYQISARTLQRYFEATTSISSKDALQIIRIRKALMHFILNPADFHWRIYGYYDHSHFYKHARSFIKAHKDRLPD